MIQSAQVATARNARHINRAALLKMVSDEKATIYDEEIFGWEGYVHDLEFVELNDYHELTNADVRQVNVWANTGLEFLRLQIIMVICLVVISLSAVKITITPNMILDGIGIIRTGINKKGHMALFNLRIKNVST